MATVNVDLRVGALEETITVTGESPIVDVQSTRSQQIIDRDVLAAIPSSRNVDGIQAIIPGMTAAGDSGGINGTMQGGAAAIHGGRANDSRIYADGINMGWAGSSGGGGQMPQVAAAQEVVMTVVGRARRSRDERSDLQRRPARGVERLHRPVQLQRLERRAARQQLHAGAPRRGPARPVRAHQRVRRQCACTAAGSCGTSCGSTASTARSGGERTVPGMFYNKNAGNPNSWTVDFDRSQQAFNNSLERQATIRLTWQATPRNKFNFHWAEQYNDANYGPGGGTATTTPEASSRVPLHPVPSTPCHLAVADHGPAAGRGGLGHVSGPVPLRAAQRRHATTRR